jgi:hypothetical protein
MTEGTEIPAAAPAKAEQPAPAGTQPEKVEQPAPAGLQLKAHRRLDPLAPVVLVVAIGILIAALHHPQVGMYVAAGGLAAAAVLRLVLRERDAGSLVVRLRQIDFVLLAGLAIALGVLAAVTPFPKGSG